MEERWFTVWGVVAVQIEGRTSGLMTVEDRLVLVKAVSPDDAKERLKPYWSAQAEPYMNSNGELVSWQLVNVLDVYDLSDEEIDPGGTEVYSRLRKVRIK